jgi:hypothetical protein
MNTRVFDDQNAHDEYLIGLAKHFREAYERGEVSEHDYQAAVELAKGIKEIEELKEKIRRL